jgi:hypothetical protein
MNAPDATVNAAVNAITDIHEIRGPVAISGEWLWLWIALGAVLFAAAVIWGSYFFMNRKRVPVEPPKPAWERALDAIARIEKAGYVQKGLIKEYYSELSGVVRWYIEERLDVRAPEMTTEEFIHAVRYSERLTNAQQGFLRDFLNASDMVKFAKFVPTAEEMFRALRLARVFVEETR